MCDNPRRWEGLMAITSSIAGKRNRMCQRFAGQNGEQAMVFEAE